MTINKLAKVAMLTSVGALTQFNCANAAITVQDSSGKGGGEVRWFNYVYLPKHMAQRIPIQKFEPGTKELRYYLTPFYELGNRRPFAEACYSHGLTYAGELAAIYVLAHNDPSETKFHIGDTPNEDSDWGLSLGAADRLRLLNNERQELVEWPAEFVDTLRESKYLFTRSSQGSTAQPYIFASGQFPLPALANFDHINKQMQFLKLRIHQPKMPSNVWYQTKQSLESHAFRKVPTEFYTLNYQADAKVNASGVIEFPLSAYKGEFTKQPGFYFSYGKELHYSTTHPVNIATQAQLLIACH